MKYSIITIKKKNIKDFAKERNGLLKKSKSEWVFFLDSDEKMTPALKREISALKDPDYGGFYVKRKNYFLGRYAGTDKIVRLGKKNSGKWVRKVHEIWKIKGKVGELKNPIIHNTAGSVSEMVNKINFYSTLHAQSNKEEGKESNLLKIIFYPKLKFIQSLLMGRDVISSTLQAFHSFLSWVKEWELAGKKRKTVNGIFLFLFLVLFPFGQIIRIGILQPIDIVAVFAGAYAIFSKLGKPKVFKYFENFMLIAGFSWVFGALAFGKIEVFYGLFYLVRLFAYFYFFVYVWNYLKQKIESKKNIVDALSILSLSSAIFGWIQYVVFPNIKPFTIWGWDDHLFRLVGTFLDPTFLGIIIVFGLLITIYRYIVARRKIDIIFILFLLISLAFTYSRASYLAFFAGLLAILLSFKKARYFLLIVIGFLGIMLILPTANNHVLSFSRQFSAIARLENYSETFNIFKTSPIFGVGYDNLCLAKAKDSGFVNFNSHACSGSDSSILFILATTGILGLISFVHLLYSVLSNIRYTKYYILLISSFVALLVHSLFSNSLVYPWVLGWMIILVAVSVME